MYCLKISLRCIHWSPPSQFVAKRGSTENGFWAIAARGEEWRVCVGWNVAEKAPFLSQFNDVARISCLPRVPDFLALTKYKWARHVSENTKPRRESYTSLREEQKDISGGTYKRRERRKEGKEKASKEGRQGELGIFRQEVFEGRSQRQVIAEAFFLRDQGCSVTRGDRQIRRPLDPQIVRLQLERGKLAAPA